MQLYSRNKRLFKACLKLALLGGVASLTDRWMATQAAVAASSLRAVTPGAVGGFWSILMTSCDLQGCVSCVLRCVSITLFVVDVLP